MGISVFPESQDSFTDPTASTLMNSVSHSKQHSLENDALSQVETFALGLVADAWLSTVTYEYGNIVTYMGASWQSTSLSGNKDNIPSGASTVWTQLSIVASDVSAAGALQLTTSTRSVVQVTGEYLNYSDPQWGSPSASGDWTVPFAAASAAIKAAGGGRGFIPPKSTPYYVGVDNPGTPGLVIPSQTYLYGGGPDATIIQGGPAMTATVVQGASVGQFGIDQRTILNHMSVNGYVSRVDTVSYSSSSTRITDSSINPWDKGAGVSGVNIPANSYVGTVFAGAYFTLVNASGTPVTPTGSGTSITLAASPSPLWTYATTGLNNITNDTLYVNVATGAWLAYYDPQGLNRTTSAQLVSSGNPGYLWVANQMISYTGYNPTTGAVTGIYQQGGGGGNLWNFTAASGTTYPHARVYPFNQGSHGVAMQGQLCMIGRYVKISNTTGHGIWLNGAPNGVPGTTKALGACHDHNIEPFSLGGNTWFYFAAGPGVIDGRFSAGFSGSTTTDGYGGIMIMDGDWELGGSYHTVIPAGIEAYSVVVTGPDVTVNAIVADTATAPLVLLDQSGHWHNPYTIKNFCLFHNHWETDGEVIPGTGNLVGQSPPMIQTKALLPASGSLGANAEVYQGIISGTSTNYGYSYLYQEGPAARLADGGAGISYPASNLDTFGIWAFDRFGDPTADGTSLFPVVIDGQTVNYTSILRCPVITPGQATLAVTVASSGTTTINTQAQPANMPASGYLAALKRGGPVIFPFTGGGSGATTLSVTGNSSNAGYLAPLTVMYLHRFQGVTGWTGSGTLPTDSLITQPVMNGGTTSGMNLSGPNNLPGSLGLTYANSGSTFVLPSTGSGAGQWTFLDETASFTFPSGEQAWALWVPGNYKTATLPNQPVAGQPAVRTQLLAVGGFGVACSIVTGDGSSMNMLGVTYPFQTATSGSSNSGTTITTTVASTANLAAGMAVSVTGYTSESPIAAYITGITGTTVTATATAAITSGGTWGVGSLIVSGPTVAETQAIEAVWDTTDGSGWTGGSGLGVWQLLPLSGSTSVTTGGGSSGRQTHIITAGTTALVSGDLCVANASSGAITATLPSTGLTSGAQISVTKSDATSNAVTVTGTFVGGATSLVLGSPGDSWELFWDGAGWLKISRPGVPGLANYITATVTDPAWGGVDSNNDWTAAFHAISTCGAPYGAIIVPPGQYQVGNSATSGLGNTGVLLPGGWKLQGYGIDVSRIQAAAGSSINTVQSQFYGTCAGADLHPQIDNITIGNVQTSPAGWTYATAPLSGASTTYTGSTTTVTALAGTNLAVGSAAVGGSGTTLCPAGGLITITTSSGQAVFSYTTATTGLFNGLTLISGTGSATVANGAAVTSGAVTVQVPWQLQTSQFGYTGNTVFGNYAGAAVSATNPGLAWVADQLVMYTGVVGSGATVTLTGLQTQQMSSPWAFNQDPNFCQLHARVYPFSQTGHAIAFQGKECQVGTFTRTANTPLGGHGVWLQGAPQGLPGFALASQLNATTGYTSITIGPMSIPVTFLLGQQITLTCSGVNQTVTVAAAVTSSTTTNTTITTQSFTTGSTAFTTAGTTTPVFNSPAGHDIHPQRIDQYGGFAVACGPQVTDCRLGGFSSNYGPDGYGGILIVGNGDFSIDQIHCPTLIGIDSPTVTVCSSDVSVTSCRFDTTTSDAIRLDSTGHWCNPNEIKNFSASQCFWESPGFPPPVSSSSVAGYGAPVIQALSASTGASGYVLDGALSLSHTVFGYAHAYQEGPFGLVLGGGVAATVASGSNGVAASSFAGSGTLNISGLNTLSASGAVQVPTSGTTAVITYTGSTSTTLTGCTLVSGGSGTFATGGTVTQMPLLTGSTIDCATAYAYDPVGGASFPLITSTGTGSSTTVTNTVTYSGSSLTPAILRCAGQTIGTPTLAAAGSPGTITANGLQGNALANTGNFPTGTFPTGPGIAVIWAKQSTSAPSGPIQLPFTSTSTSGGVVTINYTANAGNAGLAIPNQSLITIARFQGCSGGTTYVPDLTPITQPARGGATGQTGTVIGRTQGFDLSGPIQSPTLVSLTNNTNPVSFFRLPGFAIVTTTATYQMQLSQWVYWSPTTSGKTLTLPVLPPQQQVPVRVTYLGTVTTDPIVTSDGSTITVNNGTPITGSTGFFPVAGATYECTYNGLNWQVLQIAGPHTYVRSYTFNVPGSVTAQTLGPFFWHAATGQTGTIVGASCVCSTGTCVVQVTQNGSGVSSLGNGTSTLAVSSTAAYQACGTAPALSGTSNGGAGDEIACVVSSPSSCAGLTVTVFVQDSNF